VGASDEGQRDGAHRADDPLLGRVLADRYQIEHKLGEGGMGSVYLARHTAIDKEVALKVLHGEFSRNRELVERFLQEARAASRIRHENIIDITDFGSTPDGYVFFAMELLEGQDLHEVLARAKLEGQTLPWGRIRHIFLQVCAALEAAHEQGIVHRDLKPENIYLVEWYGHADFVKLLDFGIAKMTESKEEGRRLTKTGMLFGTPEYMSPEQARGEHADHRVDVYAMGCILYQMLAGQVPFEADNFMGVLTRHLTDEPPPLTEALPRSGAPQALEVVVRRALTKPREQRYQTIREFADAVARLGDEAAPRPVLAASSTGRRRTEWTGSVKSLPELEADIRAQVEPAPGRPVLLIGGAIVLAALVGGGAYWASRKAPLAQGSAAPMAQPAIAVADAAGVAHEVTVTIESDPAGAEVRDATGVVLGKTPHSITRAEGSESQELTLVLDGFEARPLRVEFRESRALRETLVASSRERRSERRSDRRDSSDRGTDDTTGPSTASDEGSQGATEAAGSDTPASGDPAKIDGDSNASDGANSDGDAKASGEGAPKAPKCDPNINKDCARLKSVFPPE